MSSVVFIGTFDPMHGAHIGQLLRAYAYMPFSKAYILVDKHPAHKPHAAAWEHRLRMAELTFAAFDCPFEYEIMAVEDSMAHEFNEMVDYKVTGIDSLLENLGDEKRWPLAQRWPMIVLSIPGVDEADLSAATALLPKKVRPTIRYEYVSASAAPVSNYDFDKQAFISRRVHATYIRSGKDGSLIPPSVRQYIVRHRLYQIKP